MDRQAQQPEFEGQYLKKELNESQSLDDTPAQSSVIPVIEEQLRVDKRVVDKAKYVSPKR